MHPMPRSGLELVRDDAAHTVTCRDGDHVIVAWCHADELAIPHWFPLRSPSGKDLVEEFPEKDPHHRAMWIADRVQLGDGPDVDFYHCWKNLVDAKDKTKGYKHFMRQVAMPTCEVRDGRGHLRTQLRWLVDGRQPVLDDDRTLVVTSLGAGEALLDLTWSLTANYGAVKFHSDWIHYAWPYLRVHPRFCANGGGVLVDDVGRRTQAATNGQFANWVDYSNTIDGVAEGVAVFLPQDGEWRKWLTRDYGTFGPRRPEPWNGTKFTLAQGEAVTGKVRLFVHRGDAASESIRMRYRDWVEGR